MWKKKKLASCVTIKMCDKKEMLESSFVAISLGGIGDPDFPPTQAKR